MREVANEFHFTDNLCSVFQPNTQHNNTSFQLSITYNEAIKHLTKAIQTLLSQEKKTTFSSVDKLMRQSCHQYQGCSSIYKPNGRKFRKFSQFVDAIVKDGKLRKHNQELFLIDVDTMAT